MNDSFDVCLQRGPSCLKNISTYKTSASYHFDFNSRRKQLQAAKEDKARKSPDSISNKTTVESVGRAGLTYTSPETIQSKLKVSFQNFGGVVKLE